MGGGGGGGGCTKSQNSRKCVQVRERDYTFFGHFRALCPSSLQIPQSRGRLALISLSSPVVEAVAGTTTVVVEVAAVAAGLERTVVAAAGVTSGSVGSGQVVSLHSSGQYSRILLKRYHCLVRESPDGMTRSGKSVGSGLQSSFKSFMSTSRESDLCLTKT